MTEANHQQQMATTSPTTTTTSSTVKPKKSLFAIMSAGGFSGTISAVATQPFDVIKTNMINVRGTDASRSMLETTRSIVQTHGVTGLWRGTIPTFYRVLPGAAIYFSMLDTVSNVVTAISQGEKHTSSQNFAIGFTARAIASTIMCPITVLKTRYELSTYSNVNVWRSLISIYQNEGTRGLFSGLLPTLGRDAPYAGISYLCFRHLQTILGKLNETSPVNFSSIIDPIAGGSAGTFGTLITYPFDVVRTRMQLQIRKNNEKSPGIVSTFSTMIRNEGYAVMLRGVVPRMMKRTVSSAISWTIFEFSVASK